MFPLKTVEEYQAQALARLPTQFLGKPRLEAFLLALSEQHQDAETGAYTLYTERLLESAAGAALEQLGLVVGQPRGGLDDASYRLRIAARLLLNRSSGTVPEILSIFALLTVLQVQLTEYPPAAFELVFSEGELELPSDFASILSQARAAGVGALLLYQLAEDADTFTLAGNEDVGEEGLGFPLSLDSVALPTEVVNPGGAINPVVFISAPPRVETNYFVTVTVTSVNVGDDEVFFDYSLEAGGPTLSGSVLWLPGEIALLPVTLVPLVLSGLAISFSEDEPYQAGDTWTWEVTGISGGGQLAGALTA